MNKTMIPAALAALLCVVVSSTAAAQTQDPTTFFLDINAGGQTQSRSFETTTSFPLHGETAVINTAQGVSGGGIFDLSVGYRFMRNFAVGLGVTTFSDTGDASVAASIPSPAAFNRPASVSTSMSDLKHREVATHLMLVYTRLVPAMVVPGNLEVALNVGPSFFNVSQDLVTAAVPTGTQNLNLSTHRERATAVGANIGVNVNYLLRPNYGAGVFLRYAGASADFDTAGKLKVGGLQLGIGLRLRY
ncbi:MAG TPA: hypothetical protein VJM31_15635 [Vicinamibacterales bacterium]|nr:hypothetical protein [Vicinamibacterales bacterium]